MNVQFTRAQFPSDRELEQIQFIYETNFPPAERKSFDSITQRLQTGEYLCFIARSQHGILAFALLLPLPDTNLTFLEYIAVDQTRHSQGLGSGLLHYIIAELNSSLIWEVEPPLDANPHDVRNRRLRFYEHLGGQLISISTTYAMPDFEKGSSGLPLRLMQIPAGDQPSQSEVIAIIRGIYRVAYPCQEELRDAILKGIGEPEA
jgi:GNAT superfamily N-acetyltransferase